MQISKLIDLPLWDRARWTGTVFGVAEGTPPFMGLAFENAAAGIEIFKGLRTAVGGEIDRDELIRIAIIEGAIPGREPGYSVHVGPRPEALFQQSAENQWGLLMRMHRMNPPGGQSPYLAAFKAAFAQHKRYWFLAAALGPAGQFTLDWDHAIGKTRLELRDAKNVGRENDLDSLIFNPDPPTRETLQ